jgi:hypothetical protein
MDGGVTLNRTEMIPECRQQMPTGVSHGLFEYRILVNRQIADISPVDYTLSDLYPAFNIYVPLAALAGNPIVPRQLARLLPSCIGLAV